MNLRLENLGREIWWLPGARIRHFIGAERVRLRWQLRSEFEQSRCRVTIKFRERRQLSDRLFYGGGRVLIAPWWCAVNLVLASLIWPFRERTPCRAVAGARGEDGRSCQRSAGALMPLRPTGITTATPMSEPLLISIVIPAFNAETTLAESLESVQSQTFADFEVVIVDDGSTDGTPGIARRFCAGDPRFSLMVGPHAGVSAARNAALDKARGGIIAFLDADDTWFPEKLERQIEVFREEPRVNLVFTNCHFWDGQRDLGRGYRTDKPLPEANPIRRLMRDNPFVFSTVAVRREFLSLAGGFDPELSAAVDWDLWLRMAERGLCARGLREPLARYRRSPGSVSADKVKMAAANVRMFERRLAAAPRKWQSRYRRALALARGKAELAGARALIDSAPDAIAPAIWRAWRHDARRLKWLLWYLAVIWPRAAGGAWTAEIVRGKLRRKW